MYKNTLSFSAKREELSIDPFFQKRQLAHSKNPAFVFSRAILLSSCVRRYNFMLDRKSIGHTDPGAREKNEKNQKRLEAAFATWKMWSTRADRRAITTLALIAAGRRADVRICPVVL